VCRADPRGEGTLTFDLAGGSLTARRQGDHRGQRGRHDQAPGRPQARGYTFKCWKGSEYAAGAQYKVEGDTPSRRSGKPTRRLRRRLRLTFDLAGGTLDGKTGKVTIEPTWATRSSSRAPPSARATRSSAGRAPSTRPARSTRWRAGHTFTASGKKMRKHEQQHSSEDK
jgi:hypothetical protein